MDVVESSKAIDHLFTEAMLATRRRLNRPILVALCGAQGTGKSTAATRATASLAEFGMNAVAFSLDDFYLTRAERLKLGNTIHPLLATRGVPGTHDLRLMKTVIDNLLCGVEGTTYDVPAFDKAIDDRLPPKSWATYVAPVDIVLLEGWCVGARPQLDQFLTEPINNLERYEDPDGSWRRYVNGRLGTDYATFFEKIDLRLMLRAPSFDCVYRWRAEQELQLQRRGRESLPPMTGSHLYRFIAHYERLTRWILADQPADLIAELDDARQLRQVRWVSA